MERYLRDYAYYRTGGTADLWIEPASYEDLATAMRTVHRESTPYFLLGGGTNSLVPRSALVGRRHPL